MKHLSSVVMVVLAIIIVAGVSVLLFQKAIETQPADDRNPVAGQTDITGYDNQTLVSTIGIGSKQGVENYLTDQKGMALYYFANDTAGKSNCAGTCAQTWPAFYVSNLTVAAGLDAADVNIIKRADGSEQTTDKGWPLYHYSGDSNPGDIIGNGFDGLWHLASPSASKASVSKPAVAPAAIRQAPIYPQVQPNIPGMGLTGVTGGGNPSTNYQPSANGGNLGNTGITGGGYSY